MSYDAREISVFQGQPYELYKFEMGENLSVPSQWFLTSGDTERTLDGDTYTPEAISRGPYGKGSEDKDNTLKVTLPRDHAIVQLFATGLPAQPVSLVLYRGHDGEAESETIAMFTGRVVSRTWGEDGELNCAPSERILRRQIPRLKYQPHCNKVIYSAACGVDKELFRTDATLTAVADDLITATEFGGFADGWFTNGFIDWNNTRRMIIDHTGNDLTLISPIDGLVASESVAAYPGCPRTYLAGCTTKFSNAPNFWGFEWIPSRNPFNGVEW